jgi:transposase-like protein
VSELVAAMTAAEARTLTDQAKERVDQASALAEAAVALVEQVIANDGHRLLGYSSPSQYLRAEFDVAALQFTPDERREMALMLVRNGVSKRGTAQLLGVSEPTVRRDLSNASRDALPDRVETSDGRSFPLSRPAPDADESFWDEPGTDEVVDAEVVDEPTRPEPPKPKRRPLPEAFAEASRDYIRAAERLARLTEDDRFPKNRDTAHHQLPELLGALDNTTRLIQAMHLDQNEASEEARRWWATSLHNISDALADVANSIEQEQ